MSIQIQKQPKIALFKHSKKNAINLFFLYFSIFSLPILAQEQDVFDLVLAGGAVKTCSSFSQKNCVNTDQVKKGKQENLYRFTPEGWHRWSQTKAFQSQKNLKDMNINDGFLNEYSGGVLGKNAFLDVMDKILQPINGTQALSDATYYALLDSFEAVQILPDRQRQTELVSVLDSKMNQSILIYQAFIQQALLRKPEGQEKAKIGVVTASSRDPFESADFYEGAFAHDDVEVIWLPIDSSWQAARALARKGFDGCGQLPEIRAQHHLYYRERIYPQRTTEQRIWCEQPQGVNDLIAGLQGIFFNGGDQSKTLAALTTPEGHVSEELALIKQQVKRGTLVVGGTSAGTAVQGGGFAFDKPIPMLTNGHPKNAMQRGIFSLSAPTQRCSEGQACDGQLSGDDITVKGSGGTGLFHYGLIDTHFSERDRETRLAVATFFSQQRFGFGVDETTAMLVRYQGEQAVAKVIGEGGVYVVDFTAGELMERRQARTLVRQLGGMAHYFPSGTEFAVGPKGITLLSSLDAFNPPKRFKLKYAGDWEYQTARHCGTDKGIQWQRFGNQYLLKASDETQFFTTSSRACGYLNLPFVIASQGSGD